MNEEIIQSISSDLKIKEVQVNKTLELLKQGNTIPFISRYRKEATGNLDEDQIRKINEVYEYQVNLLKRKEDVIRLIKEKGLLTEELHKKIMQCLKLIEIEDLYRPFKEKKKTKATEATKNGLTPLANLIIQFPNDTLENLAKNYITKDVPNIDKALEGASYIIAENISDNAHYRKWIRQFTYNTGIIETKKKKNAIDEKHIYEMYYTYQEPIKYMKTHRIMAVNRAEKEKIVSVNLTVDTNKIIDYLKNTIIKKESPVNSLINQAIKDSYQRLIAPSIARELRSEITAKAEDNAVSNFSQNLEKLLMQPPMKNKVVLGFDPAFRTGCKLAVVDVTGKTMDIEVIYPHEPKKEYQKSKDTLLKIIEQYKVDIIAIGNGTASRESEMFVADVIKSSSRKVKYIIVSEAGASVYSASPLAQEEFPTLHVEERSAISIARRLQDPLSELVKIDPESIGVGLYQHDVNNKKLSTSLDFVVSKSVNQVGVNINSASICLLKYVSGLNKTTINKIINYRNKNGKIKTRKEIEKSLSKKAYEQAIGFLRILDGDNPLDRTSIHPESYTKTINLLKKLKCNIEDIGTTKLKEQLQNIDLTNISIELDIDNYTLQDIIKALMQPNRDPRDDMVTPLLKSNVLTLDDLSVGMKLEGTVRNVTPFGAFIDIGLKNDGLAHISKLSSKFIKDPMEIVNVGDIVECYVDEILLDKNKVSLTLIKPGGSK